jgi:Tfp pilus assembly protein PilO
MKRIVALTLLAALTLGWSLPVHAQQMSMQEYSRRSAKLAKKQQKAYKKAAKRQAKAQKKALKAQPKAIQKQSKADAKANRRIQRSEG